MYLISLKKDINVVNFLNWGNPTRVICLFFCMCFCTENVNSKEKKALTGVGRASLEHPEEPMGTGGVLVVATPHV